MVLGPWSKVLGIRFSTIGDFETKVFERNYVIAIICFFDTCNQKTILQLRDGKFPEKSAGQGSPLVGGPLALRPYPSREGAVSHLPGFFIDKNSVF